MPARAGEAARRKADPLQLAADPRAARRCAARVAHEVAHLVHLNHGPDFQALVARLFGPGLAEAKAALRRVGPRLRGSGAGLADRAGGGGGGCGWRGWRFGGCCCGRERLVELLLASARRSRRACHRLLLRIALVGRRQCRSACRWRRPSADAVRVDRAGRRRPPPRARCQSGIGTWVSNCSTGRLATAPIMKSWKARAGAVPPGRPGNGAIVVAAHPDAGGQPARKADEPAVLVGGGGAGLAGDRAADLRGAAGAGAGPPLEQVGHLRRHPGRDQHALFVVLVLVEQGAVGGGHPADAVGRDRDARRATAAKARVMSISRTRWCRAPSTG